MRSRPTQQHDDVDELKRANRELRRQARLKDEFLANMSHELRTPLSAILGLSETLTEGIYGELKPLQRHAVEEIASSGAHLLELINAILDLSKISVGRMEIHRQPVVAREVGASSLTLVREQAERQGVRLSLRLSGPDAWVDTDALRLRQILVNLLSNAVKFTPEGGRAGLEVAAGERSLRLTVWDTGIGIEPELISRLFEPYVQLDGDLGRKFQGTGLGLTLVSRLADLLEAELAVESELGKGSRFSLTLRALSSQ